MSKLNTLNERAFVISQLILNQWPVSSCCPLLFFLFLHFAIGSSSRQLLTP